MSNEASQLLNHLVSVFVGYRASATKAVAREVMLHCDGTQMRAGHLMNVRTKHIGAGVYHVWLEAQP